jgi:hypothetical protein
MKQSATMRDMGKVLVAHEAQKHSFGKNTPAVFGRSVKKLRAPVFALTGGLAFTSLLSRALVLAGAEVRWLRAVHVKADGSIECPPAIVQLGKEEIMKAEGILVGHFLGLLVTFIGEALTLRLLSDAWPEVRSINSGVKKVLGKSRNEKTKKTR